MNPLLEKIARRFHPSERIVRAAHWISRRADAPWAPIFFALMYFCDSFLMFLPADSLMSVTLLIVPRKTRTWILAAMAGTMAGFLIFYLLSLSSFKIWAFEFVRVNGLMPAFATITANATQYGYAKLAIGVLTAVPPIACLVGGIVVGLDPFTVFLIASLGKFVRIILMLLIMRALKYSIVHVTRLFEPHAFESIERNL